MIRLVEEKDLKEWLRMRKTLWPDCVDEEQISEITGIFNNEPTYNELGWVVLVYERESGGLGGFLEASVKSNVEGFQTSPICYIEGWYIDSDLRGQGLGKQLVNKCEEWALSNSYSEMGSDVEFHNALSLTIHKHLGYKEIGANEESILLKKKLL